MKISSLKRVLSASLCAVIVCGTVLTASAEATDPVFVDFSQFATVSEALQGTYDATDTLDKVTVGATDAPSFSNEVFYNDNGNKHLFHLSVDAVQQLIRPEANDGEGQPIMCSDEIAAAYNSATGYYIAYNVEPGTQLTMRSLRKYSFWQYAEQRGYEFKFRFYVSKDYETWENVEAEVDTEDVDYPSDDPNNKFTKQDTYLVEIPMECNFVRIYFPNVCCFWNVFTYDSGAKVFGNIADLSYVPASDPAAPLKPTATAKTIDFKNYENKTMEGLKTAYDYSLLANDANKSLVFTTANYYMPDYHFMLSLSEQAVNALSTETDTENPYYISYNVEGGTTLSIRSLRKNNFWKQIAEKELEYDFKFKFMVSSDYASWSEVTPAVNTVGVNYPSADGWNPYDLQDTYTVNIPVTAKFVKILFPNRKNLQPIFGFANGHEVFGTIAELTYYPATNPAEKLADTQEPERTYGVNVDIAANSGDTLSNLLDNMVDHSDISNFSLGNWGEYSYYQKDGATKNLLILKEQAIWNLAEDNTPYFFTFNVEPGSSFRIQSLYRENEMKTLASNGWSYRFKFYISVDGNRWEKIEPAYYNEEGFVTDQTNGDSWKKFTALQTFVVDIPEKAAYLKVEFPQDKAYPGNYGFQPNQFCNCTIAAIKNYAYTTQTTAQTVTLGDSNYDGTIDILDLVALKKKIAEEKTFAMTDNLYDEDNVVDSNDLLLLKQYILGEIDTF